VSFSKRDREYSFQGLYERILEDFDANGRDITRCGFQAIAAYRFGVWILGLPRVVRLLLLPFYAVMYLWVRNIYGIEISYRARIGRRFRIAHQGGIVIHPCAQIGDDCLIRHNVTIGATGAGPWTDAPILGNGVEVGCGATILGKIRIGDCARIGPQALVLRNVPAGGMAVSEPARILPPQGTPTPVEVSATSGSYESWQPMRAAPDGQGRT